MRIAKSKRGIFEPIQTENDVLGAIRTLLEANGARVFRVVERIPWGKTKSEPGIPDLIVIWPEKIVRYEKPFPTEIISRTSIVSFVEVKRPGGKLRPAQKLWIEQAQADGVICFMADSVEAMVSEFKKYGIEVKGL